MKKMASLIKFFKAYGYDNYTTDGFDLARRVRIKGTRIGVIIYDDVVVPYYYAFGKYHCGYARSIDLYDEPITLLANVEMISRKLEKHCLNGIKTYKDMFEFLEMENIKNDNGKISGYNKRDCATLILNKSDRKNIMATSYGIIKKPAFCITKYNESAHAFYLRVIEAYGDKVVMF